ncbi:hypothetical protein BN2497_12781 [Janthinobacterium sp. CG23_2]|nr:hypothetical protein BN2497_12781 [Janthinobacterium sp. CG23_2]CUU32788.1 hypothetical protein BN3177_12781 [Janthinobacterium sp. CG23_2]
MTAAFVVDARSARVGTGRWAGSCENPVFPARIGRSQGGDVG